MVTGTNNGGNDTPDNVESGKDVIEAKVSIKIGEDGKPFFEKWDVPEVSDDVKGSIEAMIGGASSFNKKNHDLNKQLEALQAKQAEFEQALKQTRSGGDKPEPSKTSNTMLSDIAKYTGISVEELYQMKQEEPERLAEVKEAYLLAKMEADKNAMLNSMAVITNITKEGYSVEEVKAIQKTYGISDMNNAFTLLKTLTPKIADHSKRNEQAEKQAKINYIPKSDGNLQGKDDKDAKKDVYIEKTRGLFNKK